MFWKNFQIGHKMFIGFGAVTVLMLSVLGYSYLNFNKEHVTVDWNIHTYNVIREADAIEKSLIGMESGARGYAITGKDDFLDPFDQGKADFETHLNKIKDLTSDNVLQQSRLSELKKSYENWVQWETDQLIAGRQKVSAGQAGMEELIAAVQTGVGKKDMVNIQSLVADIIKEEQGLLDARSQELKKMERATGLVMSVGGLIAAVLAVLISLLFIRIVVTPVKAVTRTFKKISQGDADFEFRLNVNSKDELGEMAKHFNTFMDKIREITMENLHEAWIKTGQTELNEKLRGAQDVKSLAASALSYISRYVDAQIGTIYVKTEQELFRLLGSYAYKKRKNVSNEVKLGEGLVGQAALERQTIMISNVPEDYIKISSGIGEAVPGNILVTPCIYNNEVKCIIEIGAFHQFSDLQMEFIERIAPGLATVIHSVESHTKTQELLEKTLLQAEELQAQQEELRQSNEELEGHTKALKESEAHLQAQQEELRQSNEELEEQTRALKESEARMQSQQEELKVINEELEERTKSLELQKNDIFTKNENLRNARNEIEEKAKDLETASKYKSEFLANMSHELRTPLNSILVLSQMLSEKKDNTPLTDKQLEFARTIHSSGEDLLKLINDILDLSKVEAGKMEFVFEELVIGELVQYVERAFRPIAFQKGLDLAIMIEKGVPENIVSDSQRVQQIINNLLSNAFKFTSSGSITLTVDRTVEEETPYINLNSKDMLRIAISDTGIGIPKEKQEIIFEAFKQSDGTTSRKYGGTGLGLSISKELAAVLGGKIELQSEPGKGSTFTLYLPISHKGQGALAAGSGKNSAANSAEQGKAIVSEPKRMKRVPDDRAKINPKDKLLLMIEDDEKFAKILLDLAHDKGYKCIVAEDGQSGLELAKRYEPDAVLLDIGLPDINGWKVIEHLKADPATEKIPVHVVSGNELKNPLEALEGLVGYLQKPVSLESLDAAFEKIGAVISKPFKKLLIIDESKQQTDEITKLIGNKDIQIISLDNGADALSLLRKEPVDCMILDLKLRDMSGFELLEKLKAENIVELPVIIHTEKILTLDDEAELRKYAESIIIKGSRSVNRLIAEATLFLHDLDSRIEQNKIKAIKSEQEKEDSLKNRKILVVDDDMRNVFALSSLLEEKGMKVVVGRNGTEGIERLKLNPDVNLVLMDIMMPGMDGYTAMKEIRRLEKFQKIPIIALTAKAMKDDKQKCIEAGASDYLTKPLDVDKLTSLLRVWLYK